jgi:hypothetical protein
MNAAQMDEVVKTAVFPSSLRRGGRDLKKLLPKASFGRSGRGGQKWTDHPVCAAKVASRLFLIAQAPLLYEEGTTSSIVDSHPFGPRGLWPAFVSISKPEEDCPQKWRGPESAY